MIGILFHPKKESTRPLADAVCAWLQERGAEAWIASSWDRDYLDRKMPRCSLLVVIGGDGSILRAARAAAPFDVPVFSINMGRLGFLSEAQPDAWEAKLTAIVEDRHWLETRLMLEAEVVRDEVVIASRMALNDFVISRGKLARVLRLDLHVDGSHVTHFVCDGIIAATPTGSTAYALAAGGPILPPALLNYLLVPVAPHLSLDRALVLHQEAVATVVVNMDHEATLTSDGHDNMVELMNGDRVVIRKARYVSTFARVGNASYFYRRLMGRLRLEP